MWPLSSREGGGKALVAGPLKKELYYFASSLSNALFASKYQSILTFLMHAKLTTILKFRNRT